jgi:hypothetical protein
MNKNSLETIRPLSIGNVVSSGLVLYRSNLNNYFGIAVKAILWLIPGFLSLGLIPFIFVSSRNNGFIILIATIISLIALFFCIGKSMASQALIARLAYQEIINQPETINEASSKVYPKTWNFVGMTFRISLRIFGIYFLMYIALIFSVFMGFQGKILEAILIGIFAFIIAILTIIYFVSRWFVSEVALAVEEGINDISSMQRSWDLSKGAVGRLQLIVFVAFLVTLPVQLITGYLPALFFGSPTTGSPSFFFAQFVSLIFSLIGTLIVIPFWQSIKAVIYYDLRSRAEGIDLQLRRNLR